MPDEAIFQVARRIVSAILQHVTYNELLPVLLGPKIYKEPANGLVLTEYGYCKDCYMPNEVDPSTSVEFISGAFRYNINIPNVNSSFCIAVCHMSFLADFIHLHRTIFPE